MSNQAIYSMPGSRIIIWFLYSFRWGYVGFKENHCFKL